MKRLLLILSIAMLCGFLSAQTMHRYNTNFTINQKNFVDTISIEFENDQIYIPVRISGKTYRFNLDTGASQGLIYYGSKVPVLQELGNVVSHDANNIADTIKVVRIEKFQMGKLSIDGYVASVVKHRRGRENFDGIIGFDLFNKGIAGKIDVKNKQLILSDIEGFFKEEKGEVLKYNLKWFVPYINISPFMRHMDKVLFDTGARQLYQMNKESFLKHQYKSKQVNAQVEGKAIGNFTMGTNGVERQDEVYFLNLDRLKWNDFAFQNVRTITTQGASRIGGQLLNYGSVVINPSRKQLIFQSYNGKDSVNVSNKQFGVAFIEKEDQPVIGLIWQKSDAYKAGMRQGDVVLKINHETINNFEKFRKFKFEEGKKYKFILKDTRGFNKEIIITR